MCFLWRPGLLGPNDTTGDDVFSSFFYFFVYEGRERIVIHFIACPVCLWCDPRDSKANLLVFDHRCCDRDVFCYCRISKFGIIKVISNFGNFWKQKFMCFWNRLITMAVRFLLIQPLHYEYMFYLCTSNSVILYYEMWTYHVYTSSSHLI